MYRVSVLYNQGSTDVSLVHRSDKNSALQTFLHKRNQLVSCLAYSWTLEMRGDMFVKRRLTFNGLRGVISQKMVDFITTAVRTSNPTAVIALQVQLLVIYKIQNAGLCLMWCTRSVYSTHLCHFICRSYTYFTECVHM
jgi:hypothetical protein